MGGRGMMDRWASTRQREENGHSCEDGKVKVLFEK